MNARAKYVNRIKFHLIKLQLFPYKSFLKIDRSHVLTPFGGADEGYGVYMVAADKGFGEGVVFSFGIGEDAEFEMELANQNSGIVVYAFDPTPKSVVYMDSLRLPKNLLYSQVGLSDQDGEKDFYLPENEEYVSGTAIPQREHGGIIKVPVKRVKTFMREYGITHINLMKLDIEGMEFAVVPEMFQSGVFPDQICVECHERFFKKPLKMFKKFMGIMKKYHYVLVYRSKSYEEYTFIRETAKV